MTIEQKALELVNAVGVYHYPSLGAVSLSDLRKALCRALEAHEADKSRHAAELREQAERFSEAAERAVADLESWIACYPDADDAETLRVIGGLCPFILAPVDPLVEALKSWGKHLDGEAGAAHIRAALDARGLAIVKKESVNG